MFGGREGRGGRGRVVRGGEGGGEGASGEGRGVVRGEEKGRK